ncbi:MAG: gliding motility-associated C-terminal domain-containing protein [Phaeodactylibacter sp.]|nr:gliding motility-associated C-terminal domain-containing protein [Phaeodactylibacter sp.]
MNVMASLLVQLIVFSFATSRVQDPVPNVASDPQTFECASDLLLEEIQQHDPVLQDRIEKLDQAYALWAGQPEKTTLLAEYTLPVVIHIIHDYGNENISDAQALNAVDFLNDAYENVGYYDQGTGVNTDIAFCLAQRDPEGNATTGITRTVSGLTEFNLETQDLDLKDLIRWDPTQYINIWVVRDICSISVGCGVAGYATFPASHGDDDDGIVVEADYFGSAEPDNSVLAHEMGHYLGLYHTFHQGCANDDCLADGDMICDTPPDGSTISVPCSAVVNSCSTDVNAADPNNPFTNDEDDQYNNYMDYSGLDCYNAFTQGQTARMQFYIEGPRASLLDSDACTHPCPNPMTINFIPSDTIIEVGTTLNFDNLSVGATSYEWRIDGNLEAITEDFVFTFNTEGTFEVELTLMNGNPDCTVTLDILVRVIECLGNAYVSDATGVDAADCGLPGNPCKTIQYALDNVLCPGDTVFILSGTYSLPAATPVLTPIASIPEGYGVTFFGVETNGPVVIDGNSQRRGFQYNYTENSCPDANTNDGIPSVFQLNFVNLTLQNCWVVAYQCGNTNFALGGAIQIYNDEDSELSVSVENCIFRDNFNDDPVFLNNSGRSVSGAAIYINGRHANNFNANTEVSITESEFTNNRCQQRDNGGHGGAICLINCNFTRISNSYFCENSRYTEEADAGDMDHDRNAGGALLITDTYTGGDLHLYQIDSCYFVGNSATSPNAASFPDQSEGGAIFLTRGDNLNASTSANLLVGNSYFYNNFIETGIEHIDNNSGNIDLTILGPNVFEDDFVANLANDTTVCDSVLVSVLNPLPWGHYEWSDGTQGPSILATVSGEFIVTLRLGNCEVSDTIEIEVTPCIEICGNGIDDDGDGLVDCCDPDLVNDACCADHPFLNLGPDTLLICDNGVVQLMADTGFVSYEWQDGSMDPVFMAEGPGRYWVTVEDSICGVATDTITLIAHPDSIAQVTCVLDPDCPSEAQLMVDPDFVSYQWFTSGEISCTDCPNPTIMGTEPVQIIFVGGFESGCYSADTIVCNLMPLQGSNTVFACPGESVVIFGETVTAPGTYSSDFVTASGCDSVHTTILENYVPATLGFSTSPSCAQGQTGSATVIPTGTGPFSYNWSVSGNTATIQNVGPATYSVTVTDGNNCVASGTVTVPTLPAPDVALNPIAPSCLDECDGRVVINPLGTTGLSFSVDGIPVPANQIATELCAGLHTLEVTDSDGCVFEDSFLVPTAPELSLGGSQVITAEPGTEITINVPLSGNQGAVFIEWSPTEGLSCTDCLNPSLTVTVNQLFVVSALDANGCFTQDSILILAEVNCTAEDLLEIPNVFTPNNDDVNDTFQVLEDNPNVEVLRLDVYNRWGQQVFSGSGTNLVWDGRQNGEPAPTDTYAYIVEVLCGQERLTFYGEINLIR